jgi:hypothetical protein
MEGLKRSMAFTQSVLNEFNESGLARLVSGTRVVVDGSRIKNV